MLADTRVPAGPWGGLRGRTRIPAMTPILCVIFLVSGTAALLFETLWFRQAGLALGNTVWASALVTASFMAGLAIGNGDRRALEGRVASPLPVYSRAAPELSGFRTTDRAPWTWLARRLELPDPIGTAH
jgi:hypothetical protein